MDVEMISKANYSSAEPVKVSAPVVEAAVTTSKPAPAKKSSGKTANQNGEGNENTGKKEHKPSEATIQDAVNSANRKMMHTRCEYSYHEETNRVSIKVIDDDTDEVIREIPPKESLDMLQKMWEMAGILVDEKR